MSIYGALGSCLLGFFPFLFFLWRRLREDWESGDIFTGGAVVYLFAILGGVVFSYFSRYLSLWGAVEIGGVWFWGAFLFFVLSFLWVVAWKHFGFFETFEALGVGLLYLYFFVFLMDGVFGGGVFSFLGAGVVSFLLFLFFFLEERYKRFSWYKSGRVGFSGLFVLGVGFLIRAIVAGTGAAVISFVGIMDVVLSGAVAFLMFFSVFNLSEIR